uniref:Secreted protein n=1 Tax=Meloidogyne hapla TaxID=6305 RepID=A0A1I8B3J1_MELHA
MKQNNILLIIFLLFHSSIYALKNAVVNKLTVYEDGAIEAECGPLPCGSTGICSEDLSSLLLRCCSLQAGNKIYIGTDLVTLGSYYTGGIVPEKDMMGTAGIEYDFVANARTEQGGVRVWVYRIVCQSENHRYQQQQQPSIPHPSMPQQKIEDQMSNDEQPISEIQEQKRLQKDETIENKDEEGEEQSIPNPLQYRPRRNHQQSVDSSPANRVI